MRKAASFYLLLVGTSVLAIVGLLHLGQTWVGGSGAALPGGQGAAAPGAVTVEAAPAQPGAAAGVGSQVVAQLKRNAQVPLARLLVQLLVIVAVARLLGGLFQRFGQPAVIGEIVAGVLLGPSLLGAIAPDAFQALFPPSSLGSLKLLAEIGVLVFMFVVGLELDTKLVRSSAHAAVVVSHASIVIPYTLGVSLSIVLYRGYAPAGVPFINFALFMGIAMSITAFPVLARILEERKLSRTALGSTALSCAAVDDVTAWSLLALVVAIVGSTGIGAVVASLVLAVVFIVFMATVGRRSLARFLAPSLDLDSPPKLVIGAVLLVVVGSAFATEAIGIHALFGAFLAGLVMPQHPAFRERLIERLESFSAVFLLPLFFAFTGLRTRFDALDNLSDWMVCAGIVAVATLGKLGGSMIAARWSGLAWGDAFALGALMNTRGLMELIALNVGYELGILTPSMFSMLVLMAVVTTCLTGPLLTFGRWAFAERRDVTAPVADADRQKTEPLVP
jgi:Kef-type K+ transport system membrane component KefB